MAMMLMIMPKQSYTAVVMAMADKDGLCLLSVWLSATGDF